MHISAMDNARQFFDTYLPLSNKKIIEIGSQDVNGSIRSVAPTGCEYIGVDFVEGKGVDVILTDPYSLPFEDESADVIVSSSVFEHSEMFWMLFLEILRVLKQDGLFYLNVPSNGAFHRYPVDCWRFYPDACKALVTWANRSGYCPSLLESYTSNQDVDIWNDFVAVYAKDSKHAYSYPKRILHTKQNFLNGCIDGGDIFQYANMPEDIIKLQVIKEIVENKTRVI